LLRHEYAAASAAYQQVLQRQGGTAGDYYQAARAAARHHESQAALGLLTQAVAKGYFSEEDLRTEEDFASLTAQPGWHRLLAQARTKQQQHEAPFNQPLVALLKRMYRQDQQYRLVAEAAEKQYGPTAPQIRTAMQQQDRLDRMLSRQVDSLIARYGYPGKSLVGEYQKKVAFFVIQHNPDDKYLPLLKAAADKGELPWSTLALFIDRTNQGRRQPQVYGSQFGGLVDGHYTIWPIEDEPNVNARRAKVGLGPLEEYMQLYNLTYQVPTAARNPNPPALYASLSPAAAESKSEVELLGGYPALYAQLRYPAAAQAQQVRGRVLLQLTVDKAGVPRDVAVVKGLGYGCDEEALRVMRAARYTNSAGEDHEMRLSLPFPYEPGK
jgi:TonB family protein